ncbi:hypothetical protein [Micromonospora sp. WMMD964]|uniref:hypothetical protein n=1 Tax=Micromonospora sp. WMMD964 TaxID=3016091 RepID=UPI00249C2014|nr:hypothetical protein [Micromonospora sp. WMMD964]WFF02694.1 hypothetical protein O7616_08035 [Micromonospora sp. WMMD964]
MDPKASYVKREILISGSDDWVSIADIVAFAREAIYGDRVQDGYPEGGHETPAGALATARDEWLARQERAALPLGVEATKELLRDGLICVGATVEGRFVAWSGSTQELESRIDSVVETATYPLLPGDLFWVANTVAGTDEAESEVDR